MNVGQLDAIERQIDQLVRDEDVEAAANALDGIARRLLATARAGSEDSARLDVLSEAFDNENHQWIRVGDFSIRLRFDIQAARIPVRLPSEKAITLRAIADALREGGPRP